MNTGRLHYLMFTITTHNRKQSYSVLWTIKVSNLIGLGLAWTNHVLIGIHRLPYPIIYTVLYTVEEYYLTWSITGVIKRWILGALKRCFLPSLPSFWAKGRLMTYCRTSSSLVRLKSFRIFEARLGPSRRGTLTSVRPGIS